MNRTLIYRLCRDQALQAQSPIKVVADWITDDDLEKIPAHRLRALTGLLDSPLTPGQLAALAAGEEALTGADGGPVGPHYERLRQARNELSRYIKTLAGREDDGILLLLARAVHNFWDAAAPADPDRATLAGLALAAVENLRGRLVRSHWQMTDAEMNAATQEVRLLLARQALAHLQRRRDTLDLRREAASAWGITLYGLELGAG